jgi:hypothetical protein
MSQARSASRLSVPALAAATLTAATAAAYALLIGAQDGEWSAVVVVVLAGLVVCAVVIAYGAGPDVLHRRLALVAAGSVILVIGVLSIATVGLPLLLAAVLALMAGLRRPAGYRAPLRVQAGARRPLRRRHVRRALGRTGRRGADASAE